MTVDEYLETITPTQKDALERIRQIVKRTVPEAEETIAYGMPTYNYKRRRLIQFAAYKDHISLFGNVGDLESKLQGYKLSHKGTISFTEDNPISEELLEEIIRYRMNRP